jgi:hypothetical protein
VNAGPGKESSFSLQTRNSTTAASPSSLLCLCGVWRLSLSARYTRQRRGSKQGEFDKVQLGRRRRFELEACRVERLCYNGGRE